MTVSGLIDPDTIIKRLNRAGKPAQLWDAKPAVVSDEDDLSLSESSSSSEESSEQPRGQIRSRPEGEAVQSEDGPGMVARHEVPEEISSRLGEREIAQQLNHILNGDIGWRQQQQPTDLFQV